MRADADARLDIYKIEVDNIEMALRQLLGGQIEDKQVWTNLKVAYAGLVNSRKDRELAYSKFQEEEFAYGKEDGYMAITHQKFVGTGYFDRVMNCVTGGESSVEALEASTEKDQF
jgi:isocitrate lyase